MEVNVNGVNITLTPDQLKQIDQQVKKQSLKPIERIKSYEDACEDQGEDVDSRPFKNPTTKKQHQSNAHWELMMISDALRGGKELDWDNSNQKKWSPYFDMRGNVSFRDTVYVYWASNCTASARLAVLDSETAEYFGKQFLSTWKIFNGK